MTTQIGIKLNFLKNLYFAHEYFEFTDANDIKLFYSNESLGDYIKANTITLFKPGYYGADEKLEIPGLAIKDVEFFCDIPESAKDTLVCHAFLMLEAQSQLMNDDINLEFNDSLKFSLNNLENLGIFVDPSGTFEFIF